MIINLRNKLTTLKNDLERTEKEYQEKKELLIEKEKLETAKQISLSSPSATANGFVNYVSSIYSKLVCYSQRAIPSLTKNQLSLQINDKNEFEVVDYLNNGRTRSVKTLSGVKAFRYRYPSTCFG